MNNYIGLVVALLEHQGLLTEDEARKLCRSIQEGTIPDNYEGCSRFVKTLYGDHGIGHFSSKLQTNDVLSEEVKTLRAEVEGLRPNKPITINKIDYPKLKIAKANYTKSFDTAK